MVAARRSLWIMAADEITSPQTTIPTPDPTERTTKNLQREIASLKELLEQMVEAETKLTNERFRAIEEVRKEQKQDTKESLAAALQAAKEAVREQTAASEKANAKTESSFSEQLAQQTLTTTTALNGQIREINDLKERLTRLESEKRGGKEANGSIIALIGVLATLLAVGMTIAGIVAATGH